MSIKTKNFIVGSNVKVNKILHQNSSGTKELTKVTESNENSTLTECSIKPVSGHDRKVFHDALVGIIF